MEEGKNSSVSTTSNPRWNPTKEQISLLENLYKQGVRTPTAEEIQQITGKLREYGSIEGKNVFYWFQNHKARQRQKQRQQTFTYYSRLLQRSPQVLSPVVPVPRPNAAVSPSAACNNVGECIYLFSLSGNRKPSFHHVLVGLMYSTLLYLNHLVIGTMHMHLYIGSQYAKRVWCLERNETVLTSSIRKILA